MVDVCAVMQECVCQGMFRVRMSKSGLGSIVWGLERRFKVLVVRVEWQGEHRKGLWCFGEGVLG